MSRASLILLIVSGLITVASCYALGRYAWQLWQAEQTEQVSVVVALAG
ncbi:hypothetical protein [Corynebacterium sp. HS2168-gen11]|nr:hypothetical protein [Corynebacterium sp. HS2168-gen11]MCS4535615.1 hypothetical protein [Corynebacterium sp. HS2168-gen11]